MAYKAYTPHWAKGFLKPEAVKKPKTVKPMTYRQLAEAVLGRQLRTAEHVHHVDGDHGNNHLCNLALVSPKEHKRLHMGKPVELLTLADLVMHRTALEIAL